MTRQTLATRRPNRTAQTDWQGHSFTVTVGYDQTGAPMEVFANHAKGEMQAILADACIIISIALQWGVPVADLAKSLGCIPAWVNGIEVQAPASPVGNIIAEIGRAGE